MLAAGLRKMQVPTANHQKLPPIPRFLKLTFPAFLHSLATDIGKGLLIPKGILLTRQMFICLIIDCENQARGGQVGNKEAESACHGLLTAQPYGLRGRSALPSQMTHELQTGIPYIIYRLDSDVPYDKPGFDPSALLLPVCRQVQERKDRLLLEFLSTNSKYVFQARMVFYHFVSNSLEYIVSPAKPSPESRSISLLYCKKKPLMLRLSYTHQAQSSICLAIFALLSRAQSILLDLRFCDYFGSSIDSVIDFLRKMPVKESITLLLLLCDRFSLTVVSTTSTLFSEGFPSMDQRVSKDRQRKIFTQISFTTYAIANAAFH